MSEDVVNHPKHYNQYTGFEVIDVCEQLVGPDGKSGFNLGNAFKYLARAGWKNPEKHVEDLQKAEFYIRREIERLSWPLTNPSLGEPKKDIVSRETILDNLEVGKYLFAPPCCPQCTKKLVLSTAVYPRIYYCEDGHGNLRIEPDGSENWYIPREADACSLTDDLADMAQYGVKDDTPKPVVSIVDGRPVVDTENYYVGQIWCPSCLSSTERTTAVDGKVYVYCINGHGGARLHKRGRDNKWDYDLKFELPRVLAGIRISSMDEKFGSTAPKPNCPAGDVYCGGNTQTCERCLVQKGINRPVATEPGA